MSLSFTRQHIPYTNKHTYTNEYYIYMAELKIILLFVRQIYITRNIGKCNINTILIIGYEIKFGAIK